MHNAPVLFIQWINYSPLKYGVLIFFFLFSFFNSHFLFVNFRNLLYYYYYSFSFDIFFCNFVFLRGVFFEGLKDYVPCFLEAEESEPQEYVRCSVPSLFYHILIDAYASSKCYPSWTFIILHRREYYY